MLCSLVSAVSALSSASVLAESRFQPSSKLSLRGQPSRTPPQLDISITLLLVGYNRQQFRKIERYNFVVSVAGALGVPEADVKINKVTDSAKYPQQLLVTFGVHTTDKQLVLLVAGDMNGAGHKAELVDQILDEMHTTGLTHAKQVSIIHVVEPRIIHGISHLDHKDGTSDDDTQRGMGTTRGNEFFVWLLMAVAFVTGIVLSASRTHTSLEGNAAATKAYQPVAFDVEMTEIFDDD